MISWSSSLRLGSIYSGVKYDKLSWVSWTLETKLSCLRKLNRSMGGFKNFVFLNPHCSIWAVEVGNNPSYSWRSILSTRSLVDKDSRWRIGDGKNISIWKDVWLAGNGTTIKKARFYWLTEFSRNYVGRNFRLTSNSRKVSWKISTNFRLFISR